MRRCEFVRFRGNEGDFNCPRTATKLAKDFETADFVETIRTGYDKVTWIEGEPKETMAWEGRFLCSQHVRTMKKYFASQPIGGYWIEFINLKGE